MPSVLSETALGGARRRVASLALSRFLPRVLLLATATAAWADGIPAGSYQQSCRNISVKVEADHSLTLHASCRHSSGAWIDGITLSRVDKCIGDIFNFNGLLECSRTQIPAGSYRNSCTEVYEDSQVLTANCRDRNGGTRPSTLNLAQCDSPLKIMNVDGYLTCEVLNLPAGSYRQTCKDFAVVGSVVSGWCRQTNGNYVHTSFDPKDCTGPNKDISNQEGTIRCVDSSGPGSGGPPHPPRGCPYEPQDCPPCPLPPCSTPGPGGPQYPPGIPQVPFSRTKGLGNITFAPGGACKEGFVWRAAIPGDQVCVTPAVRERVSQDNRSAASRLQTAGTETCRPGYVWRESTPRDHVCVTPETRSQTADDNQHAAERRK